MQIKHVTKLSNQVGQMVRKWQMLFNFGKCKCIHIGHGNVNKEYFMIDTILGTSVKEKTWEIQLVLT